MTVGAGMKSFEYRLPESVNQRELLELVDAFNKAPRIDRILIQLPLPAHLDEAMIIAAINPAKDVDGFHVKNSGRLAIGSPGLVPCTPLGCSKANWTIYRDWKQL
jgi:methylenetetrahydrofolate dehydrogenase (NADP+)/methenyltetrahydrofolate cyclohydrolase